MSLTPDEIVYWSYGPIKLNATILNTWIVMAVLAAICWGVKRTVSSDLPLSRFQNLLEAIIGTIRRQIREVTQQDPEPYLPFIGSLFLYISISNLMGVIPGFRAPTGSLSTTGALAICVFFAVPIYSTYKLGVLGYLKRYIEPSPLMLPFHVIGEFSRTLALAVRLFGNIMSGAVIGAILLSVVPLFVPVVMNVLDLIIGQIQAYIFAVLATVYIASASSVQNADGEAEEQ